MTFNDLISSGMDIVATYKDRSHTMSSSEVQNNRDILSALCVTLSEYLSDYQDNYISGELKRKIFEAREIDRLVDEEKIPVAKATIKARIASEQLYIAETTAERMFRRCQNLLNAWNQILNTMASRMHSSQNNR